MVKRKLRSMVELKEFLKNPSPKVKVPVYTEEEKSDTNSGDHTVKKPTLSQRMDKLETLIANLAKEMRDGFKQVNSRIDNLEKDANSRFDRIEARIETIDARLDYVVKANNLKDSK